MGDHLSKRLCARCVLSEDFPKIKFDAQGLCSLCHAWDEKWGDFNYDKAEDDLKEIFKKAKNKKRAYDCLVPFSGGRDSSYVLYLCKEKYKLNPLAVTFNNLFMSDYAMKNIFNAVQALGVDHVFVTYDPQKIKKYYKEMIKDGGEFCSICTSGINYVKFKYQKKFNIPLIVNGTSSRVDEQSPFEVTCTHPSYVKKVLLKNNFIKDEIDDFLIKRLHEISASEKIYLKLTDSDFEQINMPDYLRWDNGEIQDTLEQNLGWVTLSKDKDHIDCRFAPMKDFLKNKQIPNFIFKQEKFSQLIRDGQMSREDAPASLKEMMAREKVPPSEYDAFLNFFDFNASDVENPERKSHLSYICLADTIPQEGLGYKALALGWKVAGKLLNR